MSRKTHSMRIKMQNIRNTSPLPHNPLSHTARVTANSAQRHNPTSDASEITGTSVEQPSEEQKRGSFHCTHRPATLPRELKPPHPKLLRAQHFLCIVERALHQVSPQVCTSFSYVSLFNGVGSRKIKLYCSNFTLLSVVGVRESDV